MTDSQNTPFFIKQTLSQSHSSFYANELFQNHPELHNKIIVKIEDPYYNRSSLSIGKIGIVDVIYNFIKTKDGHYVTYSEVTKE